MELLKLGRLAVGTLFLILLFSCGSNDSITTYTISGKVTGLASGQQVTLLNNGTDPQTVTSNADFTFSMPVMANGSYVVTIKTQPTGQICTVSNGFGTGILTNVTHVVVICSAITYTISGEITGLLPGQQVTLLNNNDDPQIITSNTSFTFSVPVAFGGSYAVTVGTQPRFATCTVSNATGNVSRDINNANVQCIGAVVVLHSFDTAVAGGNFPLISGNDGYLYGGGGSNYGKIFRFDPVTRFYAILHTFMGTDGRFPNNKLVSGNDGYFYGSTPVGGAFNLGTLFKINPADNSYTLLYSFMGGVDGLGPSGELTLGNDGNFYGVTIGGGTFECGTIFKINPLGSSYMIIHHFDCINGRGPRAGMELGSDGNFYGVTASSTGTSGTVFKIKPTDNSFTVLYYFNGPDGNLPLGKLIEGIDGDFYGTTAAGGTYDKGTIFKINPVTSVLTTLYNFDGLSGESPRADLIFGNDGYLYGTACEGGDDGYGTIFNINPANNTFNLLFSFHSIDGECPYAPLILGNDGSFYGSTQQGGANHVGTIFRFSPN